MNKVSIVHEQTRTVLLETDTVEDAEAFIARMALCFPTEVHRGDFGIDVPEELSK